MIAPRQLWIGLRDEYRRWQADLGHRRLAAHASAAPGSPPRIVLSDGLWDNPQQYMRLGMMLDALRESSQLRLIGLIGSRGHSKPRRTLEAMGFTGFEYLEDSLLHREEYEKKAAELLAGVRDYESLLALRLPHGLPAYAVFDTVLKWAKHPEPPLDSPLWIKGFGQALAQLDYYDTLLKTRAVDEIYLSHPWKIEFACLTWIALKRGIPFFHLTSFYGANRIRRFRSVEDYRLPVEHLPYQRYLGLSERVRDALSDYGAQCLSQRASGDLKGEINARFAYQGEPALTDRQKARERIVGNRPGPVVVVYSHAWFDFPHSYGMRHYTGFLDWMRFTMATIRDLPGINWVLKPHPMEEWYGGYSLASLSREAGAQTTILPVATNTSTVMAAADCIVTVHGTVGCEAVANGVPVIAADNSYYADWEIVHLAKDRADFASLLAHAGTLPRPSEEQRRRALACFACALGQPLGDVPLMRIMCDSTWNERLPDVVRRLRPDATDRIEETVRIREWLASDYDSFAAYTLIRHLEARTRGAAD